MLYNYYTYIIFLQFNFSFLLNIIYFHYLIINTIYNYLIAKLIINNIPIKKNELILNY